MLCSWPPNCLFHDVRHTQYLCQESQALNSQRYSESDSRVSSAKKDLDVFCGAPWPGGRRVASWLIWIYRERELSWIHPTDRALGRKGFGTGVRVSVWCVNEGEASGVWVLRRARKGRSPVWWSRHSGRLEGFTLTPSGRKSWGVSCCEV